MMQHVVSRDLHELDLPEAPPAGPARWDAPAFEVISLSCEISAYAPDGDDTPLF